MTKRSLVRSYQKYGGNNDLNRIITFSLLNIFIDDSFQRIKIPFNRSFPKCFIQHNNNCFTPFYEHFQLI